MICPNWLELVLPDFRKIFRFLKREILQRRLPHGLVSWRYLLAGNDPLVRAHRQLWWDSCPSLPRPIWCLVELWLWLRWVFWYAWRFTWRMARKQGNEIANRERISRFRFYWTVLRLAICWSIPPHQAIRFHLYRQPVKALDYVYDNESSAYHAARNQRRGVTERSLRTLQDKQALAEKLSVLGVPVVPTAKIVAKGTDCTFAGQLGPQRKLFCKTRSGNQGRGAFTAWRTQDGLAGRGFNGGELANGSAVEGAWRALLKLDDALVQPCLTNHPILEKMSWNDEAITVRYISQWHHDQLSCLCATLEVPAGKHESSRKTQYAIYPIYSDTGELCLFPKELLATQSAKAFNRRVWELAPDDRRIPYWDLLSESSFKAHKQFPDLWAIAWDWVVTQDGPVLLEGNSSWGLVTPQLLSTSEVSLLLE